MNRVHTGRSVREGLLLLLLVVSLLLHQASLQAQDQEFSLPDLIVVSVEPRIDAASGQLVIFYVVENQGFVRTPATTVKLFDVETNALLREVHVPRLEPRRPRKDEVAIELGDGWPGTTRRFMAMVDPNRRVDEIDEGNNDRISDRLQIADVRRLDLTVSAIEPFFDAVRGTLAISFEIANRGDAGATDIIVRLYDVATKLPAGELTIPRLGARQPYSDKISVRVLDNWRGTSRRFAAVVDPDEKIDETDEGNNNRISDPVQIGSIQRPDLAVVAVEPEIDKVINVFVTVENRGDVAAPATTVQLSEIGSTSSATHQGISSLAAGQQTTARFPVSVGNRGGTIRTFSAYVDPGNRIEEISEENNKADSKPILISDQRPDLTMTALEPSIDPAGEWLTLYFAVENRSDVAVPATQVDLFDVTTRYRLELRDIPPLPANERFNDEITIPVDDNWRGTTRGFAALIDPDEKIAETDENNNEYYSKDIEIVGPQLDLAIVGLELQKEYSPPILLIWIENQGDSDAPETDVEVRDAGGGALSEPVAVPSLAPGSSFTAEATLRIAADWPGGDVMLEAIVDPLNQLVERDKTNNRWPASVFISPDGGDPFTAANVGIAAIAAAGLILAIVWIRRARSAPELRSRKSAKTASQIWTRVRPDPGVQAIKADSPSITLPALRLRPRCDGGTQRIDFERTQPRE
jgi:subtilase family serine protease